MSIDERHVALPKLYGAPAYARPPIAVALAPRPFDPDELPIEAYRSEEERRFIADLPARAYGSSGFDLGRNGYAASATDAGNGLRARPFSLRSIAGRLLGGD